MSKRSETVANRKKRKTADSNANIRRKSRPKRISLFLDESGNSGLKLFEGEREFICCGLFLRNGRKVPLEIDEIIKQTSGVGLHGSKLGLSKLETIATELLKIYRSIEATFLFSVIDKHYFAAMKLWDCLFDAGTNPGVSGFHVSFAPLRYIIIAKFCHVIYEDPVIKVFWEMHTAKTARKYDEILGQLSIVISNSKLDTRSKELIEMAIQGALKKPDDVFGSGAIKEDSPNVTSVVMMAHELNKVYASRNVVISEITHDRQDEFGINIETLFNAVKQVRIIWNMRNPCQKHEKSTVIPGDIKISQSNCHELDLCDIACYLAKKSISTDLTGGCLALMKYIEANSYPIHMTDRGLSEVAEMYMAETMPLNISPNDLKNGKLLMDQMDAERSKRLSEGLVEWK